MFPGIPQEALPVKGQLRSVGRAPGLRPGSQIDRLFFLLPVQGAVPQVYVPDGAVLPPPVLPGHGADLLRQMGGVQLQIGVHGQAAPVIEQPGHSGVLAVTHLVPVLGSHALHHGQQLADGRAVAEDGDGLVGITAGDAAQGGVDPLSHLGQAVPIGCLPAGVAAVEEGDAVCVKAVHLAPRLVLPVPHVDLPQAGVGVQLQSLGDIDRPCGGHGAIEVAGPHRIDVDILKAALEGGDLGKAVVGDERVIPAVDAAVQIPLGLGVTDEINGGHWQTVLCSWNGN